MSTNLKLTATPFVDNDDRAEIAAYFADNGGYVVESTSRGMKDAILGITLKEDLDGAQQTALRSALNTDQNCVDFVDEF